MSRQESVDGLKTALESAIVGVTAALDAIAPFSGDKGVLKTNAEVLEAQRSDLQTRLDKLNEVY